MKVIHVGRDPNNDIVINDNKVSRIHCQFAQDENGNISVIDTNSKNGVYVNGTKIYRTKYLSSSDIVRIGNTTLQWKHYFDISGTGYPPPKGTESGTDTTEYYPTPRGSEDDIDREPNGLGTIALIISIIGAALFIYCAIKVMKWGIFTWIGKTSTFCFVSIGLEVITIILSHIADFKDYKDADNGGIGRSIAWICIGIFVAFIIYVKSNPNALIFGL